MAIEDFTTDPLSGAEAPSPIKSTLCSANLRRLSVIRRPDGKPESESVPLLRISGRWLYQSGFSIGSKVRVQVSPKRLVIELMDFPERRPRLPMTIEPGDCIY